MNYTIDTSQIILPKNIESTWVSISGWSNRRMVYVNRETNETYFQVTSESNDCHRCSLCQQKIAMVGYKSGYHFWYVKGNHSLYQKLPGVPKDLTIQSLKLFLKLPLEE